MNINTAMRTAVLVVLREIHMYVEVKYFLNADFEDCCILFYLACVLSLAREKVYEFKYELVTQK